MSIIGTYDSTVYSNAASRYCVVRIRTADQGIPEKACDKRKYRDHLIRFTAVGYDLPCTDVLSVKLKGVIPSTLKAWRYMGIAGEPSDYHPAVRQIVWNKKLPMQIKTQAV